MLRLKSSVLGSSDEKSVELRGTTTFSIYDLRFTIYDFKTEFDGDLRFDSGRAATPKAFGAANSNQAATTAVTP
jgi:hypothetical protein